jgi:hypothetical protein
MHYNNTIFNQLLDFLPKFKFHQFVGQHQGDKYTKRLTSWNQLTTLLYAQATSKKSLRDIETGLNVHQNVWYHLGVRTVAKSTLSYANTNRDYQIFEKLFYSLLYQCEEIVPSRKFRFKKPLYSFDSTTIQLCLNLFSWAEYRRTKGALKIHALLNNRTGIPELLNISNGKKGDLTAIKEMDLNLERGSILVFDRAYIDYSWWKKLDKNGITFVSRTKKNQDIFVSGQHKEAGLDQGVLNDDEGYIGIYLEKYPKRLIKIKYYDKNQDKIYEFLTNNFSLSAKSIADIYKDRWQIELFFKWIKQNLKIKTFLGTSRNAVMTQIWVAMIYYLLLNYIKFQTKFDKSLLELTRMIREPLMLRRSLIDLLSLDSKSISKLKKGLYYQMSFW